MLSLNFHRTFIPERRLIAALLEYAALGKQGTLQEISHDTDIPMGEYTGKMPAILEYCQGMGLIKVLGKKRKEPVLTPFGTAVYLHDKYLGEELTQWLVHMNLCRKDIGAKAWYEVFAKGRSILGARFSIEELEKYLVTIFGAGKNRIGPLVSTYTDQAALGMAKVLALSSDMINRHKAPVLSSWAVPYSAFILELLEHFFPGESQVTLNDFSRETLFFDVCLWHEADIEQILSYIEIEGLVTVDRQIRPWLIEKKADSSEIWPRIYDGLA